MLHLEVPKKISVDYWHQTFLLIYTQMEAGNWSFMTNWESNLEHEVSQAKTASLCLTFIMYVTCQE